MRSDQKFAIRSIRIPCGDDPCGVYFEGSGRLYLKTGEASGGRSHSASPAALSWLRWSWCWLRASATDSAGKVKAAMRGLMMAGTGNSAPVKGLRSRRSSITRLSRMPCAGPRRSRHSCRSAWASIPGIGPQESRRYRGSEAHVPASRCAD